MSVFQQVTAKELQRAYNRGNRTGEVDVAAMRLTYSGKPIAIMFFGREGVVDYRDAAGNLFARFQGQCAIDD